MFAKMMRPFAWWTLGLATASLVLALSEKSSGRFDTLQPPNSEKETQPKISSVAIEGIDKSENPLVPAGKVHWHESFDAAKLASQRSGKPVLLFHMMGYLDRQFCCSNARLARTMLFSSKEIAEYINRTFEPA